MRLFSFTANSPLLRPLLVEERLHALAEKVGEAVLNPSDNLTTTQREVAGLGTGGNLEAFMVEDRGFEQFVRQITKLSSTRPSLPTLSQDTAKAGQDQSVTDEQPVNQGTEANLPGAPCGQPRTPTTTQPQPNRTLTANTLPPDIQAVVDAWPDLPEALKAGILAMVEASRSSKR